MKDDVISRQAAISLPVKPKEDRYFQTQNLDDAYDYGWYSLQKCIEQLPSAPEPKTGKWLSHYEYCKKHKLLPSGSVAFWWCDQCEQGVEHPTNFCPNCGADMREEENE